MWNNSGKSYTKSSGKYTLEAIKRHKGREMPPQHREDYVPLGITDSADQTRYPLGCWKGIFLVLAKKINVKHWPKDISQNNVLYVPYLT